MTIQNIEDVMDRIMSLNRNLNEDSLRTLLSASGWDKGDIIEGIRIFKMRAGSSVNLAAPVMSAPIISQAQNIEVKKPAEDYSFKIKKEELEPDPKIEEVKPPVPEIIPIPEAKVEEIKVDGPEIPASLSLETKPSEDKPKKSLSAKIFTIILILILILAATFYLYPNLFSNLFPKNKPNVSDPVMTQNKNNVSQEINSDIVDNNSSSSIATSSTLDSGSASTTLDKLLKEVASLRNELNTYKQASQSAKTIVKYISQKGPTGKAGRGISSVSATSTGFIINYTDNTNTIIPYSTTTILNIINSNSVCFRDIASSTVVINDICLDREAVSKLIASSTISH